MWSIIFGETELVQIPWRAEGMEHALCPENQTRLDCRCLNIDLGAWLWADKRGIILVEAWNHFSSKTQAKVLCSNCNTAKSKLALVITSYLPNS